MTGLALFRTDFFRTGRSAGAAALVKFISSSLVLINPSIVKSFDLSRLTRPQCGALNPLVAVA